MKRSIILLSILISMLAGAVTAEYFYSANIVKNAKDIIKTCDKTADYKKCAIELKEMLDNRKVLNRIFYSKDKTENLMQEIDIMIDISQIGSIAEKKEQLDRIEKAIDRLNSFNANG